MKKIEKRLTGFPTTKGQKIIVKVHKELKYKTLLVAMSTKASLQSSRGSAPRPAPEEAESSGPKPLAATLLQEFQNLKDKFKNEDEAQEKG